MPTTPPPTKPLIMIVDDQLANIKVLSDLLEQYQFEILVAKDGQNALHKLERIIPDLILLDILMPNLDGFEACRILKENLQTRDIPVIFMSALSDPIDKVKGLTLGAVDYITKPFQHEEVITRVNIHLRLRSLSRQLLHQNEELRHEIRQRQLAEMSLRLSEEKFAKAFRSNPGPMILTTLAETRFIEVNQVFCQITDYAMEEVVGHTAAQLQLWVDPLAWHHLLTTLQTQGSVHRQEVQIYSKSRQVKVLLVSAEVITLNQTPHMLAMTYDITECKRVAAELLTNEAKYRLLVEQSQIIIWATDPQGCVTFINAALTEILGYAPSALQGQCLSVLAIPEQQQRVQQALLSVIQGGSLSNDESLYLSRSGQQVPLLLNALPIRDPAGQIQGMVGTAYDLTERVRSEEQSRLYAQAQSEIKALARLNRLKDDFVATLSHELRTPLTTIQMALRILPHTQDEAKRQQYYATAMTACEKEIRLINDLLEFQSLETGTYSLNWQNIYLPEWLAPILDPHRQQALQAGLGFHVTLDPHLRVVRLDPYLVKRILEELLSNACTYTEPQGQIEVRLSQRDPGLRLSVSNSATLPAAELASIFDKFQRLSTADPWRYGGTGLGLALVHHMTTLLGGTITAHSADGWTRFDVELPLPPP